MPKRRTAEQYAAAAAAGPPPSAAEFPQDDAWWDAQDAWIAKDPVGAAETLAPRGEPQRRKDWQRVIKQHAALIKAAPAAATAATAAAPSERTAPSTTATQSVLPASNVMPECSAASGTAPTSEWWPNVPQLVLPSDASADWSDWYRRLEMCGFVAGHNMVSTREDQQCWQRGLLRRHSV